jgi:hypothetical protein
MVFGALVLAGCLLPFQKPTPVDPRGVTADQVTLRDGSVVLGLVISVNAGSRGSLELLVRRAWAENHLKGWARKWDRAIEPTARLGVRQRQFRLEAWRRDRAGKDPGDDRMLGWIDRELRRIDDPAGSIRTFLVPVHLARSDVRSLVQQPSSKTRLLQLGWLCDFPEVESMPLDELVGALESRGFAGTGNQVPSLAHLLPPHVESDLTWRARRAATELAVDPELRFVRFHDMVMPDLKNQASLEKLSLSTVLSEVSRFLDPDHGREDPLAAAFKRVSARGRVGALVTRLEMAADFSHAVTETTLWVQAGPDRWVPFVTRNAAVRLDDLPPDAGANLAADPQVERAFALFGALGLGTVPADCKARALRMGAAAAKALGTARAAISQDLDSLALPILENGDERIGISFPTPDKAISLPAFDKESAPDTPAGAARKR